MYLWRSPIRLLSIMGVHSGTDPTVHTDGEITDVKT